MTVTTHTSLYVDDKPQKVVLLSSRGQATEIPEPQRIPIHQTKTSPKPKSVVSYDLTHNKNYGYNYQQQTEESVQYQTESPPHSFLYHPSIADLRPPSVSGNGYRSPLRYSTTRKVAAKANYPSPTTYRSHSIFSGKPRQYVTSRTDKPPRPQLPLPLLPTLPSVVFSSPAPFSLNHHVDAKRYTNDHQKPPRIIISASASVSDNSGRRLNYSLGTIGTAHLLGPSPPVNYDDYKEGDDILDPFYHDVPKIKSSRQKRSAGSEEEVIKNEQEAADILQFLFNWYNKHGKPNITFPVTSDVVRDINSQLVQDQIPEEQKPEYLKLIKNISKKMEHSRDAAGQSVADYMKFVNDINEKLAPSGLTTTPSSTTEDNEAFDESLLTEYQDTSSTSPNRLEAREISSNHQERNVLDLELRAPDQEPQPTTPEYEYVEYEYVYEDDEVDSAKEPSPNVLTTSEPQTEVSRGKGRFSQEELKPSFPAGGLLDYVDDNYEPQTYNETTTASKAELETSIFPNEPSTEVPWANYFGDGRQNSNQHSSGRPKFTTPPTSIKEETKEEMRDKLTRTEPDYQIILDATNLARTPGSRRRNRYKTAPNPQLDTVTSNPPTGSNLYFVEPPSFQKYPQDSMKVTEDKILKEDHQIETGLYDYRESPQRTDPYFQVILDTSSPLTSTPPEPKAPKRHNRYSTVSILQPATTTNNPFVASTEGTANLYSLEPPTFQKYPDESSKVTEEDKQETDHQVEVSLHNSSRPTEPDYRVDTSPSQASSHAEPKGSRRRNRFSTTSIPEPPVISDTSVVSTGRTTNLSSLELPEFENHSDQSSTYEPPYVNDEPSAFLQPPPIEPLLQGVTIYPNTASPSQPQQPSEPALGHHERTKQRSRGRVTFLSSTDDEISYYQPQQPTAASTVEEATPARESSITEQSTQAPKFQERQPSTENGEISTADSPSIFGSTSVESTSGPQPHTEIREQTVVGGLEETDKQQGFYISAPAEEPQLTTTTTRIKESKESSGQSQYTSTFVELSSENVSTTQEIGNNPFSTRSTPLTIGETSIPVSEPSAMLKDEEVMGGSTETSTSSIGGASTERQSAPSPNDLLIYSRLPEELLPQQPVTPLQPPRYTLFIEKTTDSPTVETTPYPLPKDSSAAQELTSNDIPSDSRHYHSGRRRNRLSTTPLNQLETSTASSTSTSRRRIRFTTTTAPTIVNQSGFYITAKATESNLIGKPVEHGSINVTSLNGSEEALGERHLFTTYEVTSKPTKGVEVDRRSGEGSPIAQEVTTTIKVEPTAGENVLGVTVSTERDSITEERFSTTEEIATTEETRWGVATTTEEAPTTQEKPVDFITNKTGGRLLGIITNTDGSSGVTTTTEEDTTTATTEEELTTGSERGLLGVTTTTEGNPSMTTEGGLLDPTTTTEAITTREEETVTFTTDGVSHYSKRRRPSRRRDKPQHRFATSSKKKVLTTERLSVNNGSVVSNQVPVTDAPLFKSANPTRPKYMRVKVATTPLSHRIKVEVTRQKPTRFMFNCFNREINKFYSDPRDCRLFHYCTIGYNRNQLLDMKFVCDLGTYYDDERLICTKTKPARCLL